MVLIAQLSTSQGVRSPLSHVADQVFLELTRQLEGQGVRRQVVADMFGMALRSYQKKVQRVAESVTEQQRSLWEAVFELVEKESPTRERIGQRFRHDGEREVAAVLQDLLRSGLIFVTGSGQAAVYGATSESVRDAVRRRNDGDALANLVWLEVFHRRGATRRELADGLGVEGDALDAAIAELVASGRMKDDAGSLTASNVVVPIGAEQGWESAIVDHFRAVATAIAQKVRSGASGARASDRVGGSTFSFTVAAGHPFEREVTTLLRRTRAEVQSLWDRVAAYNEDNPPDLDASTRVTFYVGQAIADTEDSEA